MRTMRFGRVGAVVTVAIAGIPACSSSDGATHGGTARGGAGGSAARDGSVEGSLAQGCRAGKDITAVLDAYGKAWHEADKAKRDCWLAQALVDDVIYQGPGTELHTLSEFSDYIASGLSLAPNARNDWSRPPQTRSSDLRAAWIYGLEGSYLTGLDYMEVGNDGRIAVILAYDDPFTNGAPVDAVTAYVAAWNASDSTTRDAALAKGVAAGVRFRDDSGEVGGIAALSTTMAVAHNKGLTVTTATVLQTYTHPGAAGGIAIARVQLALQDTSGSQQTATDYIKFDPQSAIEMVGRFLEP